MKPVCNTCKNLGDFHFNLTLNNDVVHLHACKSKRIMELFPQGRVIEGKLTKSPDWCPLKKRGVELEDLDRTDNRNPP